MTWTGLPELAPMLSEAEIRFEKRRRFVGLLLGPALFALALVGPPLDQVTPLGMRTLGVFLWTVIWWMTEPIPIPATSFFSLALLVLCGILTVPEAFGYWANWVNIFLIGAFIIGHATSLHGLTQRIAYRMISARWLAGSPWRLLLLFGLGPAVMSSVLSNVVTAIIFLSIALGLVKTLQPSRESRYGEALFISIAWGAGIGGIITPVGTPPNLIAIGLLSPLGYQIGFAQWTAAALPVALIALAAMFLVIRFVIRPQIGDWKITSTFAEEHLERMGPMKPGEKIAAAALSVAIALWMLPDLAPLFLEGGRKHPLSAWLTGHLDWSVSAILVATSLFLIPVNWKERKFAMTWPEAVKGIEWGTLSLIAAALALANVIPDKQSGLGVFFSETLSSMAGPGTSHWLLLLILVAFTVFVTNLASNVATVSMVATLTVALASTVGFNPAALTVTVALASSMAFSLPISTPPNAIVFASGQIRVGTMAKSGMVLSLISVLLLTLFGVSLAEWVFPMAK